jgi:hypothetical protein
LDRPADDKGRFILKTIEGRAFRINGLAAREAYVERLDRLYVDDNKINFSPFDLGELMSKKFEHPILLEQNLLQSDLNILRRYIGSYKHYKALTGQCQLKYGYA